MPSSPPNEALTDRDLEVLDMEKRWPHPADATWKTNEAYSRFGWSSVRYYQALDRLLDSPAAEAAEPALVHRLRRLRDRRREARRAG